MVISNRRNAPARSAVPARPTRGAASKGSGLGPGRRRPRLLPDPPSSAISLLPRFGWFPSMPTDQDLFAEEQSMVTMSFGEHIEELRVRLIMALLGLLAGVVVVFLPPLEIAKHVMRKMEEPASAALKDFYDREYAKKAAEAEAEQARTPPLQATIRPAQFFAELKKIAPELAVPPADTLQEKSLNLPMQFFSDAVIKTMQSSIVQIDSGVISLGPLETVTI